MPVQMRKLSLLATRTGRRQSTGANSGSQVAACSARLLVELLQLLANCFRSQGQEVSLANDILLSWATENVTQKFLHLWIDLGLQRIPVGSVRREIDINRARQRIC